MLKSLLILFNLLAFSFWKLLVPVSVSTSQTAPSYIKVNNSFIVQVAINKASLKGVATFTEQLPAGLTAVPLDNEGARTSFNNNTILFSWSSLPATGTLNIRFRVDVSPLAVAGKDTLLGRFLYTTNNQKVETDCAPSYITITGENGITSIPSATSLSAYDASRELDTVSISSAGVFIVRHFPTPSIAANTSEIITLTVHKSTLTGFAKIEDSIPSGFMATMVNSHGASFTFVNSIAKFVWQSLPSDSVFTISYRVTASSGVQGLYVISGKFSYTCNNTPCAFPFGCTVFNTSNLNTENIAQNTLSNNPAASSYVTADESTKISSNAINNQSGVNTSTSVHKTPESFKFNVAKVIVPSETPGISYRIQIMALHKPVNVSYFSSNCNIRVPVQTEADGGFTKYTVGNYTDYKEVLNAREDMKNRGVKGAFIVCYNSGVRITTQEALMITHTQWCAKNTTKNNYN